MILKNHQSLIGAATLLTVLSTFADSSFAQKPEPVIRTFGFLVSNGEDIPDFTSEASKAVTALPLVVDGGSTWFPPLTDYPSPDHDFEGSEWVSHPAHHAGAGGQQRSGVFFWLLTETTPEPPQVGAHTFTGPDGLILESQVLYLKPCTGADEGHRCHYGDANAGKYVLSGTYNGNANAFVVVTALFSR